MSECMTCRTDKGYLCACETDEVRARLDQVQRREDAATKGPWGVYDRGVGFHITVPGVVDRWGHRPLLPAGDRTDIARAADAQFIAHAREDVPWLLDHIQALEQRLERRRLDLTSVLMLNAETTHEEAIVAVDRLVTRAIPGEKLMTEARTLRSAADDVEAIDQPSTTPGWIAELLRKRADQREAEAKGGV